MITELEVVWLLFLRLDAPSLTSSATESVSATAPQEPTLTLRTEFARAAHPTASHASPTPSAMPVTLAMTSTRVSVSLLLSTALLVNSDTMVFATLLALLELVNKETSARELALLVLGPTTEDATELALLS